MKTNRIEEYKQFEKTIEERKKAVKIEFLENLLEYFKNSPEISYINVRVNNHEFADGDATSFSIYYEDEVNVKFSHIDEEIEGLCVGNYCKFEETGDGVTKENWKKVKEFVKILDLYTTIHESTFGEDAYEYLEFSDIYIKSKLDSVNKET